MQVNLDQIRSKVVPILKEAGVSRCAFFGSYVRGEANKDSDIDILVDLPKGKSLLDLIRLERRLKGVLGKEVDLLTYNSLHPLLKDIILKEQVQIL